MALRRKGMRGVTVKRPVIRDVYSPDERPTFEPLGVRLSATVQPLTGRLDKQAYGERAAEMLLMLTENRAELREGMGVCVNGVGGACDYRIAAPPRKCLRHTRALLERLQS